MAHRPAVLRPLRSSDAWGWREAKRPARLAHEGREVGVVVDVGDEEVVPRAFVGRAEIDRAEERPDGVRGLQEEAVVADEAEDRSVAVEPVFAEHPLERDLAGARALVGDELHEVRVA